MRMNIATKPLSIPAELTDSRLDWALEVLDYISSSKHVIVLDFIKNTLL